MNVENKQSGFAIRRTPDAALPLLSELMNPRTSEERRDVVAVLYRAKVAELEGSIEAPKPARRPRRSPRPRPGQS